MIHSAPPGIAHGQVKARHIVLLYTMSFCAAFVAAHYWGRGLDRAIAGPLQVLFLHTASCALFAFVTLCIPELRRSLRALFAASPTPISATDVLLTVGLMLAWGAGLHALLLQFPVAAFTPNGYDWLGMGQRGPTQNYQGLLALLVVTSVLAPIGEELVFRGYLLNMLRSRYRLWVAIAASCAFFGVFHFKDAIFAAATGVILALVYLRHGSLWPAILVHGLYNLIVTVTTFASPIFVKSRQTVDQLSSWSLEIALSLAFFPLAYLFWRRYKPQ